MAPLPPSNPFFTPPTLPSNYNLHHLTVASAHQISARTRSVLSILDSSTAGEKSSSSTADETARTTKAIESGSAKNEDQVTIVALTAPNPKAAGKLISIVEIAKREIAQRTKIVKANAGTEAKVKGMGQGWWQYTQLKSVVRDVPREGKRKSAKGGSDGANGRVPVVEHDDDEDEDAFEPMPAAKADAKGKRDGIDEDAANDADGRDPTMKKRAMPVLTIYLSTAPVKELRMAFGEQT